MEIINKTMLWVFIIVLLLVVVALLLGVGDVIKNILSTIGIGIRGV